MKTRSVAVGTALAALLNLVLAVVLVPEFGLSHPLLAWSARICWSVSNEESAPA